MVLNAIILQTFLFDSIWILFEEAEEEFEKREMKERVKALENIKKEDLLSSDEALEYLRKIKK